MLSDSEFLQVVYAKPFDICYDFAAVLNLMVWGKVALRGSTMALLGKAMVRSNSLSVQATCIWHLLAIICDASFDWGSWAPSLGKGWSYW